MRDKLKNQEGITLVALIVTIIVLLIIAGIGISQSLSQNGSIEKTSDSIAKGELAKVQQAVLENYVKYMQTKNIQYLKGKELTYAEAQVVESEFKELDSNIYLGQLEYDQNDNFENYYYKINKTHLTEMGLRNIKNNYEYMVNYSTGEVFNLTQKKTKNGAILQIAAKNNNYVNDGLVLHLDGINNTGSGHSDTATTWKDLSGNDNDFNKLSSASNPIWSDNSFVGDKTNRTMTCNKAILANSDGATVEVCYDIPNLINYYWVFQSRQINNPANGFQFVVTSTLRGITIFKNHTTYNNLGNFISPTDLGKSTMAFAIDSSNVTFSYDAQFYSEPSIEGIMESITPRNCYTIGSNYPWGNCEYRFKGNIYSIRIYNRKLTEKEMKHNYEVDKTRFNITD